MANSLLPEQQGVSGILADVKPSRQDQAAHLISQITNPAFVALPTFLAVALHTAPTILAGLLWWVVTTLGISVAPLLHVSQGVRVGRYSDHHLSRRSERLIPFGVGLAGAGGALVILLVSHASRAFLATAAAVLVGAALAMAITHGARWKISLHVSGLAGAITVLTLLLGWTALVLVPLVPLVGWARWRLGAHTPAQAISACVIAVGVTVSMFWIFGLL